MARSYKSNGARPVQVADAIVRYAANLPKPSIKAAICLYAAIVYEWGETVPFEDVWPRMVAARLLDTMGAVTTRPSRTAAAKEQPLLVRAGKVGAISAKHPDRFIVDTGLYICNSIDVVREWTDRDEMSSVVRSLVSELLYLRDNS